MKERKIILASGSRARNEAMVAFGINYKKIISDFDEKSIRDDDLGLRAMNLAKAKAKTVAETNNGIIIDADSFFVLNDVTEIEKPKDKKEARQSIELLSGNKVKFITGFYYLDNEKDIVSQEELSTEITFRKFTSEEIEYYVNAEDVFNFAGGLPIGFRYAHALVDKIEGSLTSFLYGLPMEIILPLLRQSGVKVDINNVH